MILQRLIMDNFRQFQNSNKIDFTPRQSKHINIVFASNGVGKTTILTAINWCLYGGKKLHYGDLKNQFLNNNTFMNLKEGEQSEASVTLSFEDRGRKYVITRKVIVAKENSKQENKDFSIEVFIDNEKQYYGQQRIDAVLGSAMKEYFFFDGEGIGRLADSSRPELIQKGIKNVMKIDTRQSALILIQKAKQTFDKESTKIQAQNGVTDIPEERIEKLENELNNAKEELDSTKENRDTFEKILLEIDKQLLTIKDVKKEAEQKQKFEKHLKQINKDLKNLSNEQKDLVAKKAYLALSQKALTSISSILEEKQKRGELPLLGIGRHFIEEILEKHRCICGEKFIDGDEHYKHLKEIMSRATVKSEIEASLSSLGIFVEAHKSNGRDFLYILEKNIQVMENLKKNKSQLEQKLEEIIDEIEEGLLDTEENLATKQKEIKQEIEKQIKMIGRLESAIETLQDDLRKAKHDLELSTALSDEVQLIRDRIQYCDKAISLLEEKNKEEIEEIRKELSVRLEKRFDKMLHSDKKAMLDESFRLTIVGNDGQPSAKSRGEDKLISLIFISTLIDYAREKENEMSNDSLSVGAGIYPIVVDSPYGEFDTVYKKTISLALKDLAPQVIILLSQEQWSEDIESIFSDSLANVYRLVAHRPKLSYIQSDRNQLYFMGKTFELEVQDDTEHTSIERIGVNYESI